jgi:hypothetical protein
MTNQGWIAATLFFAIAVAIIAITTHSAGAADKREEFRDKNGFYQGSAVTHGNTTTYRDKNGFYKGTVTRTNPRPQR